MKPMVPLPLCFVVVAAIVSGCAPDAAAQCNTPLTTVRVAAGLSSPVFVTAPPGDTERLFIVEQGGVVRILDLIGGVVLPTPFLEVLVTPGGERGLLGLAFDPDYDTNGYLYVNYTRVVSSQLRTYVARYQVSAGDPNRADPFSQLVLLSIDQPFSNHNGGWIGFGPDGYLYIATGDGGSGGDPGNRAQNIEVLLGKLLRIDVRGAAPGSPYAIPPDNPFVGVAGADEIWAYGLRNPWRNSFDRLTGDLYIADVGQNQWEEINFQPASSPGGENYGWRCYEGNQAYNTTGCPPAGELVFPIHEYSHALGCSITGGYVYRGGRLRDLRGTYFFADYCSARLWSFRYDGQQVMQLVDRTTELRPAVGTIDSIASFGEDAAGELYICDLGGEVFKIVPNGVLKGDLNNDGLVNFGDINPFVLALTNPVAYSTQYGLAPEAAGDLNCDGRADFGDVNPFIRLLTSP